MWTALEAPLISVIIADIFTLAYMDLALFLTWFCKRAFRRQVITKDFIMHSHIKIIFQYFPLSYWTF